MKNCIITFRSVTPAQRAEETLRRAGVECAVQRTPKWMEDKGCENEVWYSRGETEAKKNFRVNLVVSAKDECEIENWLANVSEVELMDWSVE